MHQQHELQIAQLRAPAEQSSKDRPHSLRLDVGPMLATPSNI